jgi:hypothetical protein
MAVNQTARNPIAAAATLIELKGSALEQSLQHLRHRE